MQLGRNSRNSVLSAGHRSCSPTPTCVPRQVTLSRLPQLVVLSYDEITSDTQVESLGTIFVEDLGEQPTAYAFQAA